jgi:uncharacterized surface protein with fasciclin (FAS1) repeats
MDGNGTRLNAATRSFTMNLRTVFTAALTLALPLGLLGAPAYAESACSSKAKAAAASSEAEAKPKDIVDTAVAAGTFKTLAAALGAAGLVDALKGEGPFTVFAPTDAAFAKLPAGTVESLLKPENKEKLVAILKYHVVSGKVMAADVTGLKKATTLSGQDVKIDTKSGVVVGGAKVSATDIAASNGVIHVIDSVMMPPTE